MPDYSKGKIYTIRNKDDNTKIYVGSTIKSLEERLKGHKRNAKQEQCINRLLFKEVNNDWTNWYIELYENYSCSSKKELLKREGEIIKLIGTLNKVIPGRNMKDYRKDNAEEIKEYKIQYRIKNEEKEKEQTKQYRIKNTDKIKEKVNQYYNNNAKQILENRKQYRIDNIEKIKEKEKQYRINNADKIKEKNRLQYLKKKNEKLSI